MTAPRPIFPGRIYLVTRRCSQRQFLLRPDEVTDQIFAYCVAEAALRFDVGVLAFIAMSNHYHGVFLDTHGNLPDFLAHLHTMVAKVLNARWEREENLWSSDACSIVYLVEDRDVLERVIYAFANPLAVDLVERVRDWPGASSFDLLDGRVRQVRRPQTFFRRRGSMPRTATLRVVVPPSWRGREKEWADCIRRAVERREVALRKARLESGRRVVGRRRLMQVSPFARATSSEQPKGRDPVIACANPVECDKAFDSLRAFRCGYAASLRRFLGGDRSVVFPPGTFKLRHLTAPVPTARPGPAARDA